MITLNQSSRPINDTIDNSNSDISTCTPVSSSAEFYDSEEKYLSQSETEYLHDDENMPIFKTPENISIKGIFHVLMLNIDKNEHYIGKNVPYRVTHSSNFIVDPSCLSSVEDVKCNDGEAMKHKFCP